MMDNRKAKKKGYQGRNTKDCGRNLRLEASWPTEDDGILPCRAFWKIEELCMKKNICSWLRQDVEGEKAEMKRLNEKAKQEESKSGEKGGGERRRENGRSKEGVGV